MTLATGDGRVVEVPDVVDHVFGGARAEVVTERGTVLALPVARWRGEATESDHRLFVDRCSGPTLDVGCGPGRLAEALAGRGVHALGLDISAEAVRQARGRGAAAVRGDVFGRVPAAGAWGHGLLADGNIGIGGDPVRLLRRVGKLVGNGGTVLVEVEPTGVGVRRHLIRLRVGGRETAPFWWARVGVDQIATLARASGLVWGGLRVHGNRAVAELAVAG